MQPIFFLGKFCQKGKFLMWNVKMKWLLGFSISKNFCIWVLNQKVSQKYRRVFKCFLTSISCSEPNLAKSSYGWLPLLATSQNWPKIKHFFLCGNTPLLFVPMTKEGCIFCFGMDLLGPHYDQSDQIIDWTLGQTPFLFFPF